MRRHAAKSKGGTYTKLEMQELGEIGHGSFGRVLKMRVVDERQSSRTSAVVAVKNPTETPSASGVCLDVVEKELLQMLDHKNVVSLLYYYGTPRGGVNLVMELVEGGDLFDFLRNNYSTSSGIGIYNELFAYQMFRGLGYIHSKKVAHRDIKPENLLVNASTGTLKITDFGLGTRMKDPVAPHVFYVGTRVYRAPELLLGSKHYDTKIDVWAGAVVITQMLLLKPIFFDRRFRSAKDLMIRIFQHIGIPCEKDFQAMRVPKIKVPSRVSRVRFEDDFADVYVRDMGALVDLLQKIFVYNVEERFGPWNACAHHYFSILKQKEVKLPNGHRLPALYDFTREETASMPKDVYFGFNSSRKSV